MITDGVDEDWLRQGVLFPLGVSHHGDAPPKMTTAMILERPSIT